MKIKSSLILFLLLASCAKQVQVTNVTLDPLCSTIGADVSREKQDCAQVRNEFILGKQIYEAQFGQVKEILPNEINLFAVKVDHVDTRGVPVVLIGTFPQNSYAQAYISNDGASIFWANPFAIRCEVLHLYRLKSGSSDWMEIGHQTTLDPLHFDCSGAAVTAYLNAHGS